ncbi:MAG: DUF3891 family protein [Beijerinckiaceae bacterium]|nr:DUF3891 family protein [Beijerinckiaceae bacterium]
MIARDLEDGVSIMLTQEMHADLSAQFASHWGNGRFAALSPRQTMLRAAALHDTHFRETETDVPIDVKEGRPYGHRETPFSQAHLDALARNVEWVGSRDAYAALLVSMHHTGLAQSRYGVINSWHNDYGASTARRPMRAEVAQLVGRLEADQARAREALVAAGAASAAEVGVNYRLLQTFDLLSLYFCRDGYDGDHLTPARIEPVPASYREGNDATLSIEPCGGNTVRITPWPFSDTRFDVSVLCRRLNRTPGASEEACRTQYLSAPRVCITWTLTE